MTVKIIQVGMGGWGRSWAKHILSANAEVELVACVDTIPEMLNLTRKELAIPADNCFLQLDEALATVAADAVLITASLPAHIPAASTALQAGKHVLLEKPFAPTLPEARKLIELADQHQRILMISQNYRYYPAVQAVADLLREGSLGPVGSVNLTFRRNFNKLPTGHPYLTSWQPLLADMAIHHFDLMRFVLNQEPKQVSCYAWNPSWSNFRDPASAVATILFSDGAVLNYSGSWVSTGPHTHWGGSWHIECTRGAIEWTSRDDEQPDQVTIHPLGKTSYQLTLPEVKHKDRHGTLHAFLQALETDKQPQTSGHDNIKTLALMLATITAASTGTPQQL